MADQTQCHSLEFCNCASSSKILVAPAAPVASGTSITLTVPGDYPAANNQPWLFATDGTISYGPPLVGLAIYANNAAAVAAGLAVGAFFRTGADPDPVCVVH